MPNILLTTQNSEHTANDKPRSARPQLSLRSGSRFGIGMLFVALPYALLHTLIPCGSLEGLLIFTAKLFCAALFLSTVLAGLRISERRKMGVLSSATIYTEISASLFIGAMLFTLTLAMTLILDIEQISSPKTWGAWWAMIP